MDEKTGVLVRAERPEIGVFKEWQHVSDEVPHDDRFIYDGEWKLAEEFSRRYPPNWQPG